MSGAFFVSSGLWIVSLALFLLAPDRADRRPLLVLTLTFAGLMAWTA